MFSRAFVSSKLNQCLTQTNFKYFSSKPAKLESVGYLLETKPTYEVGQLILHRLFGYRGVVIAAWPATFYNKDVLPLKANNRRSPSKKSEGTPQTYYQVLLDNRDLSFSNSLKDGVSFLHRDSALQDAIFTVPGIDYASHEDIIPFTSQDPKPIRNELFQEFLKADSSAEPGFVATDRLTKWIEEKHASLEVTSVYRQTTEGIRVTAIPFYMGDRNSMTSDQESDRTRWWRYIIRIENVSDSGVQLRERFWKIFSVLGSLENIRGQGVVGLQPILNQSNPAFQYHSHVQLQAPWGYMWGSFSFMRETGSCFDVKIPDFLLSSKANDTWDYRGGQPSE